MKYMCCGSKLTEPCTGFDCVLSTTDLIRMFHSQVISAMQATNKSNMSYESPEDTKEEKATYCTM